MFDGVHWDFLFFQNKKISRTLMAKIYASFEENVAGMDIYLQGSILKIGERIAYLNESEFVDIIENWKQIKNNF